MKTFLKWLQWVVINTFGAYVIYLSLFKGISWAYNLFMFYTHFQFIVLFMVAMVRDKIDFSNLHPRSKLYLKLDTAYDIIVCFILASQSWYYSAVLWFLSAIFTSYIYEKKK